MQTIRMLSGWRGHACVPLSKPDYPDLDPGRVLRSRVKDWLVQVGLRMKADPFGPLLFNNRAPSPVFEIYIPVEKVAGEDCV